ncbi:MAG: hypothetical protein QXE31_04095 [Candidatus Woesearchaeota archaeon]
MEKFYVGKCLNCKKMVLMKLEFLEYDECCVNFDNLKILKVFNDESEAKNYMSLFENEE